MNVYGFDDDTPRHWCPNCETEQPTAVIVTISICRDCDCADIDEHSHGATHSEIACCICGLPTKRKNYR